MSRYSRRDRRLAAATLREDLDYYVESFTVHTCARLENVQWLLQAAAWSPGRLLMEWAATPDSWGRVA